MNTPNPPDLSRLRIAAKESDFRSSSSQGSFFGWRAFAVLIIGLVSGFGATLLVQRSGLVQKSGWYPELAPGNEKRFLTDSSQSAAKLSVAKVSDASTSGLSAKRELPPPTLSATGYVVAQRKAAVSSKATGRLRELSVEEGDSVLEGQVIGILENDDVLAIERQALADIKAKEAQIRQAAAELQDALRQRERLLKLSREKVIAPTDLDAGEIRVQRAQASLEFAEAMLVLSQAQAEKARIDVDYTLIRAPFVGTVLDKNADIGEIVAPFGSAADARAAIVTIADMSSLEVEADVSEANISKVFVDQRVTITLDSFPEHKYQGKVNNIVPTVDRAKATVMVRISFLDRDQRVLPEMSAKVEFQLKEHVAGENL